MGKRFEAISERTMFEAPFRTTTHYFLTYYRYTCILYLNDDDWDTTRDGGALRIYPGTEHSPTLESLSDRPFVDVCPGPYGRLLIFDSRTVHSVEPVLRTTGCRRALTLWINRPVDCELVPGETYF